MIMKSSCGFYVYVVRLRVFSFFKTPLRCSSPLEMASRPTPPPPPATEDNSLAPPTKGGDEGGNGPNDGGGGDRGDGPAAGSYPQGALIYTAQQAPVMVDVHPLVLLSVVDHYARIHVNVQSAVRSVGLLLGCLTIEDKEYHLDVSNCLAVPFDEDPKDPAVWFFDTNYGEQMLGLYRKVMPNLKVVGWYSSGPVIAGNDMNIHLLVAERFCPNPIYCMVNTDPKLKGFPVATYITTEAKGATSVEFRHMLTRVHSVEAEEIGIEHLLRDLTDSTVTSLSTRVADREIALLQLEKLLGVLEQYLLDVSDGKMPVCQEVISLLQDLMNELPSIHLLKKHPGFVVSTNDRELGTLVASAARATAALYDVIVNRRKLKKEAKAKVDAAKKLLEEKEKKAPESAPPAGVKPSTS